MATFVLRRIDDGLWRRCQALAQAKGITPKELLLRAMTDYVVRHEQPQTVLKHNEAQR